ncbi:MAG: hypothetical protein JSV35_03715 [Candidatus Bathyarchaeota archaeon]|nr:MAG: hypothetical protein JSV35_03715 [Candidatus Bathyarchaeota archaeon]
MKQKKKIAECISLVHNVTWAHVVKKKSDNDFDIIFEMMNTCDETSIKTCITNNITGQHNIDIDYITLENESYVLGRKGKHPKAVD